MQKKYALIVPRAHDGAPDAGRLMIELLSGGAPVEFACIVGGNIAVLEEASRALGLDAPTRGMLAEGMLLRGLDPRAIGNPKVAAANADMLVSTEANKAHEALAGEHSPVVREDLRAVVGAFDALVSAGHGTAADIG